MSETPQTTEDAQRQHPGRRAPGRPRGLALVLVLGSLTALGPLTIDL